MHTYSLYIDSLYTNIDLVRSTAVESTPRRYPDPDRPDLHILQLLELCLRNIDFSFNNKHYLQIHGSAMCKRSASAYANIYMADWELTALAKCPLRPMFYRQYLDDIFGVWEHHLVHFTTFIDILNNHHPTKTVKNVIHPHTINFMDTTIFNSRYWHRHSLLTNKIIFQGHRHTCPTPKVQLSPKTYIHGHCQITTH